jgi:S1-C subfamily serine protease
VTVAATTRLACVLTACALAAGPAACGGGDGKKRTTASAGTVASSRAEVVKTAGGGSFDPSGIYKREAPGVVTVLSEFAGQIGQGSGFVIAGNGEIATNAHVVTDTEGGAVKRARSVFVQFLDGNQVPATIVGADPDADVALIKVKPDGLKLRPLPLGTSANLVVGAPVAAIGSPFGEAQSLSIGVISGLDRTIESLTQFQIPGAIQTDAAINRGNSGGPLVDARGRVLGINSQIRSSSGGGEGVGFAVPVDSVKRSLDELRRTGRVSYAYLGLSLKALYPQLAERYHLPVKRGVWVQTLVRGGPAAGAGLKAGSRTERFQGRRYRVGGDVLVKVAGVDLTTDNSVSEAIAPHRPGETIKVELYHGTERRTVSVKLGKRPLELARGVLP